jgi:hypothetical protein
MVRTATQLGSKCTTVYMLNGLLHSIKSIAVAVSLCCVLIVSDLTLLQTVMSASPHEMFQTLSYTQTLWGSVLPWNNKSNTFGKNINMAAY